MILALGLRYRPQARDQLSGHQAKIAALVADLIDIPLDALEHACKAWTARSPYMPKASDLIELARNTVSPPTPAQSAQAWCDARNAGLEKADAQRSDGAKREIEWYVSGRGDYEEVKMRYKDTAADGSRYCTPEEARDILRNHPSSFARTMLAAIEARDGGKLNERRSDAA